MQRRSRRRLAGAGNNGGFSTSPAMSNIGVVPDDVIREVILPRLDLTSRVRLAAVSKSWHALSRLVALPAGLPWVLATDPDKSDLTLVNLNIGAPYPSIHQPRRPTESVINPPFDFVGSVDGNAILAPSTGGIVLYNPFSGETRSVVPTVPPASSHIKTVRILPEQALVVANSWSGGQLFACRLGQSDWAQLNFDDFLSDFIFHQDKLYCISSKGDIQSFDLKDLVTNPHMAIPTNLFRWDYVLGPDFYYCYYHLVESCGDLLVVVEPRHKHCKSEFLVFKVELKKQRTSASLKPVNDLADRMLFVGQTCSLSCPLPSVPLKFFTKNCIYYAHNEISISDPHSKIGKWAFNSEGCCNLFPRRIPKFRFRPVWITPHPHL